MATRLSVQDILERLDDADSGEASDYEGEEIAGYLPEVPDSSRVDSFEGEGQFDDVEGEDDASATSGGPSSPDPGKSSSLEYL